MASPQFICANWHPDREGCKKYGRSTCQGCHLVVYCDEGCQRSHWRTHKLDCRSDLIRGDWQPSWIHEKRQPSFVTKNCTLTCKEAKNLWSIVPAYDVLKLESHEGVDREEGVKLLFAGCMDLGNVVKTMAELPVGYKHPIKIAISEMDFDIVTRNLMLLLIALVVEDMDEAIDCMIHLWYSAKIRKSDIDILHNRIFPLILDVNNKIQHKDASQILCKTWTFGERKLSCTLSRRSWVRVMTYFQTPKWYAPGRADDIRGAVTMSDARKDFREKDLCYFGPAKRVAYNQYRKDGLLLPFGYPRHEFRAPNPTFFSDAVHWPLEDDADPRHSWLAEEVVKTYSGPATEDIYGRLFYYLRGMLRRFLERVSTSKLSLQLMRTENVDLKDRLHGELFDRIATTELSYLSHTGEQLPIEHLVPCLQLSSVNPHATMITLFAHGIDQALIHSDNTPFMTPYNPITDLLVHYLSVFSDPGCDFTTEVIRWHHARNILSDYDNLFWAYCEAVKLPEYRERVGGVMATRNTIIEQRPFYLRLEPGQPGAQEEFDRLIVSGVTGKERYLEWKRISLETPRGTTG